jgi:hypothetical protein
MSQCALQPVEDFFGLHIMAHWQLSSLQSRGISTLVCYASNWNRLLNRETIPYSYTNSSTGSLMSPIYRLNQGLGDKTYDLTSLSEKT